MKLTKKVSAKRPLLKNAVGFQASELKSNEGTLKRREKGVRPVWMIRSLKKVYLLQGAAAKYKAGGGQNKCKASAKTREQHTSQREGIAPG